ncbi:hypothetical protein N0B44_10415 [Roseibacterium beibuensis]|uniref:DUF7946 domain-containing protein n=1 Tax=[Roseibacterium] beibuensis TaxID=1193142 RepID=UPI0031F183B3|nr:hypothetical protein [Roseibacterium beibuensis]
MDKIVVRFLWAIETEAQATRSPSPTTVSLDVFAPEAGCIDVSLFAGVASGFMPFVASMQEAVRAKLCEHIVSYVMLRWGGRRTEAEDHLKMALDIIENQNERFAEDRRHERETTAMDRQREREHIEALFRSQADLHKADAAKAARPVGESCRSMTITNGDTSVEVDEATAEAVKAKEELEVSDIIEMTFQVDGIELSSKTLKVFDPETPTRRVKVHISDPAFDPLHQSENPYETAVQRRSRIKLTGKATRKPDGTLKTFHAISGQAL